MSENVARKEVGYVTQVNNYILTIKCLQSVRVNDLIVDHDNRKAVVHSLSENYVEALLLDNRSVNPGVEFFVDNKSAQINIGSHLKGKVIDALGKVVSDSSTEKKINISPPQKLSFDKKAKNIDSRSFIKDQLITGFALIDIALPVGKGQRELVYGPIHSGKNDFLTDIVINQKKQGNICIYAAIGKPAAFTSNLVRSLEEADVMDNTVVLSALSDELAPMITIAPSTAFLIAEYFCSRGEDVVLILNDLGIHAKYVRETALLSNQFPGRESYPGDMFYRHASLMERSGSFNEKQGNGTITLFPVLETDIEGFTNIIPTNLMGSTDGHLLFSNEIYAEGFKPAVSVLESVTRVGHMTHSKVQRELSTKIISILSEYPRQQEYSRFGTQVSDHTKQILKKGRIINELLNQNSVGLMSMTTQVMLLALVFGSFFESEENDVDFIKFKRKEIVEFLEKGKKFTKAREIASSKEDGLEKLLESLEEGMSELKLFIDQNKKKTNSENKEQEVTEKKSNL